MFTLKEIKDKGYTEPKIYRIGREQKELYALEEKRNEILDAITNELKRIHEIAFDCKMDYWKNSMIQTLYDTLDSYDQRCSILASKFYLEQQGFIVTEK